MSTAVDPIDPNALTAARSSADGLALLVGRAEFEQAASLWRSLEASPSATPFQSYDWARSWLEHCAPDAEPWLFVRDGSRPLLLATACRRIRGRSVLTLLGQGPSDYLGPLAADPNASDGRDLAASIAAVRSRFDVMQLRAWFSDEPTRRAFAAGLPGRTAGRLYEPCPFVGTTGSWNAYLASRTKKFRANLKRTARKAAESGDFSIERETVDRALFDEMVAVERESWKWESGFAYLRDAELNGFLRTVLLETALPRELWTLRLAGELAAFALVFPTPRVRYYYLPSFRARYPDVGSQLLRSIVEDSFSSDFDEFDFLQGDEAYKRPWTTGAREVYEIVGGGRRVIGHLAVLGFEARWRLGSSRRLRDWRRRALLVAQRGRRRGDE